MVGSNAILWWWWRQCWHVVGSVNFEWGFRVCLLELVILILKWGSCCLLGSVDCLFLLGVLSFACAVLLNRCVVAPIGVRALVVVVGCFWERGVLLVCS